MAMMENRLNPQIYDGIEIEYDNRTVFAARSSQYAVYEVSRTDRPHYAKFTVVALTGGVIQIWIPESMEELEYLNAVPAVHPTWDLRTKNVELLNLAGHLDMPTRTLRLYIPKIDFPPRVVQTGAVESVDNPLYGTW